jgi:phage-related protein
MAKRKKKAEPKPEAESQAEGEGEFRVVFFRDGDAVPVLDWLDTLNAPRAVAACRAVIELLRQQAFRLRRPHTDALRDGIRELRARVPRVQYRLLYFFHGRTAVITHGFIKRGAKVPDQEIERAIGCRTRFAEGPEAHTRVEE